MKIKIIIFSCIIKLAKEAATVRRTDQARKNAENRAKRVQVCYKIIFINIYLYAIIN